MAIIPETLYAGKINPADPAYPYGSARNISVPGDGTGTPWDAANLNDRYGFHQALLSAASVVPNGNPDSVTVSQYLESIRKLTGKLTDGKKYQFLAAAIKNTGGGWQFVSNADHEKVGFTGISVNGSGEIELTHGANITSSAFFAQSDNQIFGVSAVDSTTKTTLSLSAPLNFEVDTATGNITAESYWGSNITGNTVDNYCTITHPTTNFNSIITSIGLDAYGSQPTLQNQTDTTIKLIGNTTLSGYFSNSSGNWAYLGNMKNIPNIEWDINKIRLTHEMLLNIDKFEIQLLSASNYQVTTTADHDNNQIVVVFYNNGTRVLVEDVNMRFYFARHVNVESIAILGNILINRGNAKINADDLISASDKIWVFGVMEIA